MPSSTMYSWMIPECLRKKKHVQSSPPKCVACSNYHHDMRAIPCISILCRFLSCCTAGRLSCWSAHCWFLIRLIWTTETPKKNIARGKGSDFSPPMQLGSAKSRSFLGRESFDWVPRDVGSLWSPKFLMLDHYFPWLMTRVLWFTFHVLLCLMIAIMF